MLIVTCIVGFCNCSMFCCALLCVHSSFEIISMGKRAGCFALFVFLELIMVVWLFLMMPWVCLQFAIVVFPDNTHLLFQVSATSTAKLSSLNFTENTGTSLKPVKFIFFQSVLAKKGSSYIHIITCIRLNINMLYKLTC